MAAGWSTPIDLYCERTDAGFWSEPLNAVSNAAFLVAAFLAFRLWQRKGGDDTPALVLIAIVTCVGIGSFLFHTFANRWSLLADVIPIALFILVYFFLAMRRFFGLGLPAAACATIGYEVVAFGGDAVWDEAVRSLGRDPLNGSMSYVPAVLALVGVGVLLRPRGGPARQTGDRLLWTAAVFLVSIGFRTADASVCGVLPVGTHLAWHTLNAVVLFLLCRAAILHRPT